MATSSQYGSFVPTNFVWDIAKLQEVDVKSPEFKELLVRLYQNVGLMALVLNTKDTGMYPLMETVNGQQWFPNPAYNSSTAITATQRQVYRKTINFGALPNATTKSVSHGITCSAGTSFTRIYATASKPTVAFSYLPIPYATAVAANIIELYVDATNVNIVTGADYSAWTICYVIVEYIQN